MRYLLILLLVGCANSGAWSDRPVRPAKPVLFIVHVDFPCGYTDPRIGGCWNDAAQTVETKRLAKPEEYNLPFRLRGLKPSEYDCVLGHEATGEKSHAKGYTHGDQRHYYRMDCGGN